MRWRALEIEDREKCTKYFLRLEKRKAKLMNLTKLKVDDNIEITDPKSILNEQQSKNKILILNIYSLTQTYENLLISKSHM